MSDAANERGCVWILTKDGRYGLIKENQQKDILDRQLYFLDEVEVFGSCTWTMSCSKGIY